MYISDVWQWQEKCRTQSQPSTQIYSHRCKNLIGPHDVSNVFKCLETFDLCWSDIVLKRNEYFLITCKWSRKIPCDLWASEKQFLLLVRYWVKLKQIFTISVMSSLFAYIIIITRLDRREMTSSGDDWN